MCEFEIDEHGDELAGGQQNLFLRLLEDGSAKRASGRRISDAGGLGFDDDFDDDEDVKNGVSKEVTNDEKATPVPQTKEEQ